MILNHRWVSLCFAVILAIFIAALGSLFSFSSIQSAQANDLNTLMDPGVLEDKKLGNDDAPVKIIEYASMTCNFCADFHEKTMPKLKTDYIDTGKVQLIFREIPFNAHSMAASMLARCAPDDNYFSMVEILFRNQKKWIFADDPEKAFFEIVKQAGFTKKLFLDCLKNQELVDKMVSARKKAIDVYKVESTPTFFINGVRYTGMKTIEEIADIIDPLL